MAEGKISVEAVAHEAFSELASNILRDHDVKIEGVYFRWMTDVCGKGTLYETSVDSVKGANND